MASKRKSFNKKRTPKPSKRLESSAYLIGLLSFIPFLGLVFGAIAIYRGLTAKKIGGTALAILGFLGAAFSVALLLLAGYLYSIQGYLKDLAGENNLGLTRSRLGETVRALEFYNLQNEVYPASLQRLEFSLPEEELILFIYDPNIPYATGPTYGRFYYELSEGGSSYYLLALGPDGLPFTADDILPIVDHKNIGLSIHPGSLR